MNMLLEAAVKGVHSGLAGISYLLRYDTVPLASYLREIDVVLLCDAITRAENAP